MHLFKKPKPSGKQGIIFKGVVQNKWFLFGGLLDIRWGCCRLCNKVHRL